MKALLREPLVHFLALGALLFAFFEWRGGGAGPGGSTIVVTPGLVEHLASGFARTWQRPPTDAELKGLVDDHVKEEIAVREAVAMGLDRDDTIIRRRLRQKLEFLVEDAVAQSPPTDAELQAYVDAHPERFEAEPQLSFLQVYLSPERRGPRLQAETRRLLVELRGGRSPSGAGDSTMLPHEQPLAPLRETSRSFGAEFARAVSSIEPGQWTGPIESPYGLHLVLVRERVAARKPELAEIRPLVERDVAATRRVEQLHALYARLLSGYRVVIEMPKDAAAAPAGGPR